MRGGGRQAQSAPQSTEIPLGAALAGRRLRWGFWGDKSEFLMCFGFFLLLFLLLELKGRAFQSPSIFLSSLDIQKRKSHSFKSHSR